MYAALWRRLPGGRLAKAAQCAALAATVVVVLFVVVFPALAPRLPWENITVEGDVPQAPAASTTRSEPTISLGTAPHISAAGAFSARPNQRSSSL